MATPATPAPLSWVQKRDGRLEAFEPDKISRALFAATEAGGRPDPFLARELADGVLHFLAGEAEGGTLATSHIADVVAKIVRELGHPDLARAYAGGKGVRPTTAPPAEAPSGPALAAIKLAIDSRAHPLQLRSEAGASALREFGLTHIYSRDLVAAHREGLIRIGELDVPLELAGRALPLRAADGLGVVESLLEARATAGGWIAVDGVESALARGSGDGTGQLGRALRAGLAAVGSALIVNLNCPAPAWAESLAPGPLFATGPGVAAADVDQSATILDELAQANVPRLSLDWHLADRDFAPDRSALLTRVARRLLDGGQIRFVFDRPRRPVALAEGLDRDHPAALVSVKLNLVQVAGRAGARPDEDRVLEGLASLARLALSAARQKREYLRQMHARQSSLGRGFLLDRARLVVVPLGLRAAAEQIVGVTGDVGAFGQRILTRLRETLRDDGRPYLLESCLDALPSQHPEGGQTPAPTEAPGVTPWDPTSSPRAQLRLAGLWHAAAHGGTAVVFLPTDQRPGPEDLVDLLRFAWQQTQVSRVGLVRADATPTQLTAAWDRP